MPFARSLLAAVALAGVAAVPALPAGPGPVDAPLATVCSTDAAAATSLVTDLVAPPLRTGTVAGLPVAVATDPLVPPGIPSVLFVTAHGLCTTAAFNLTVAPQLSGPIEVASAFASTAGMPWLGEVTVREAALVGDTVALTTFGGRHGVTSDWTVTVDDLGVQAASFETVAFGEGLDDIDVHGLEGITSLPGNRRAWTRDADGLLRIDATVRDDLAATFEDREAAAERAAVAVGRDPGDLMEHELDGQVIRFTLGVAAIPVEGVDTVGGIPDRLLYAHRGMGRIYEQFETWGVTDVWDSSARTYLGFSTVVPDEVGYINFNSGLSAVCLACAVLGDVIEIHLELNFAEIADVLIGTHYPDDNSFTLEVIGHEFTHALQGGYADGDPGLTSSYTEATAVASQALFDEAENSAQAESLEYLDSSQGCEGFENAKGGWLAAQAAGPFVGHSYDACYFWWTYVGRHGGDGLVRLLEASAEVQGEGTNARNLHLLDLASSEADGTLDLAHWAAAYTAGPTADGYRITDGDGDVHNWLAIMQPATRSRDLAPGTAHSVSLAGSGTAGFRVTGDGTLLELPPLTEAFVHQVIDGAITRVGAVTVGSSLSAGQILTVVGPFASQFQGTVRLG